MKLDIVILSIPGTVSRHVPAAPALLKASVERAGFTCRTIDFNIRLYSEPVDIDSIETYFSTELNPEQEPVARSLVEKWADEVAALDPAWVGISVFTYQNRVAARLFCQALRKYPSIKIVLGGQGLGDGGIAGTTGFGQLMLDQDLTDFWIRSEGEVSLVELLKNNTEYPGINSEDFQQVDDLDSIPFPDYSDYDLSQYEHRVLPITGSRGCVRSCSFCDVHEHWQYRYRSGDSMANEILHLAQQHQIQDFWFSDSLINGNLKEFKRFISILADYNRRAEKKVSWRSQFIVRGPKEVSETYWENIAASGGNTLSIGVETGSDSVRDHMNKRFNNVELDYTMSKLEQYSITCNFLMIVGYPTETEADFQQTLDMFTRYRHLANTIIQDVSIGSTLGILEGTPLHRDAHLYNIELDRYENNWIAHDNPDLTIEVRLDRRRRLQEHLASLGYSLKQDSTEHMVKILESNVGLFQRRRELKRLIKIKQVGQLGQQ